MAASVTFQGHFCSTILNSQYMDIGCKHKFQLKTDALVQYHDKSVKHRGNMSMMFFFLCIYIHIIGISATERSENQNINLKRMFIYSNPQAKTCSHHRPPQNLQTFPTQECKFCQKYSCLHCAAEASAGQ